MHYDPCGHRVDMIRRPYRTRIRPFSDSDLEAEVHWYVVPDEARDLGFPSGICSQDLHAQPWITEGQGEVWNTPRVFDGWGKVPWHDTAHVCGTKAWFAEGEPYDPDGQVVVRDVTGLPECCQPIDQGIVLGGSGLLGSGGVILSAKSPLRFSFINPGSCGSLSSEFGYGQMILFPPLTGGIFGFGCMTWPASVGTKYQMAFGSADPDGEFFLITIDEFGVQTLIETLTGQGYYEVLHLPPAGAARVEIAYQQPPGFDPIEWYCLCYPLAPE